MRPVKLEIEGFTSFPERVLIDFDDLDLFAITGPTGAGKTSILDAMLYALYGVTPRIGEKDVLRLVSMGANRTSVCLEFLSGGGRYRVARTRKAAKNSPAQVILEELQGGEWNAIAGNVREVNPRIEKILGLDFEGFTRSVILPQGEFDKFLRGDAKTRTRILIDLLNLNIYERMKETANSRARELAAEIEMRTRHLETNYADANQEALAGQQEKLAELNEQLAAHETERVRVDALLKIAAEWKQASAEQQRLDEEIARARADKEKALQSGAAAEKTVEQCERILRDCEAGIAATGFDETAWTQLLQTAPKAREVERTQKDLNGRRKDRQAAADELAALEKTAGEAQQEHRKAEEAFEQAASRRAAIHAALGSPDWIRDALNDFREAARAMAGRKSQQEMEALVRLAHEQYDHLHQIHAAGEIRKHLKAGQPCPVCEQVVKKLPAAAAASPIEEARSLRDQVSAEQREWQRGLDRLEAAKTKIAQKAGRPMELDELQQSLERAVEAEQAYKEAEEQRSQTARKAQDAGRERDKCASRAEALDAVIKAAQSRLREVHAELQQFPEWAPLPLSELEAELHRQQAAKQRRDALESERTKARAQRDKGLKDSIDARAAIQAAETAIADKESRLTAVAHIAAEASRRLRAGLPEPAAHADPLAFLQSRRAAIDALRGKIQAAAGAAEERIRQIGVKIVEAAELRTQIEMHRVERETYHELGVLLASNRFISYVEREALARLAAAASDQLRMLSDGRYTLTLGKEDNEFCVIDKWNANDSRPVTTLSGGESFLASLSLALALAHGLGELSGEAARTRLDSLFIDEGISSLDAEALETAIEAISNLGAGERMVGVISHVAELGERLPGRIRVDKAPGGSRVKVETQSYSHSMVAGGL
jgi:exonuclease SbcC